MLNHPKFKQIRHDYKVTIIIFISCASRFTSAIAHVM